jgi:hypothetical protein
MDTLHHLMVRMTLVETLIRVLFAERAVRSANPMATVQDMRDQILRIMGNTTASSLSPEQLELIRRQLANEVNRVFDEIERRVREAP